MDIITQPLLSTIPGASIFPPVQFDGDGGGNRKRKIYTHPAVGYSHFVTSGAADERTRNEQWSSNKANEAL